MSTALLDSTDAERTVACAILLDAPGTLPVIMPVVKQADFGDPRCRAVFYFGRKLWAAKQSVDLLTVAQEIEKEPKVLLHFDNNGNTLRDWLSGVLDVSPTAANARYFAERVGAAAKRRAAQVAATELTLALADTSIDENVAVQAAMKKLLAMATRSAKGGFQRLDPIGVLDAIERRTTGERGLLSGFPSIDNVFGGFRPGEVLIVGGVNKSGKTAWTLNIARNMAERCGVGFVSCEMTAPSLTERLLNAEAMVSVTATSLGKFSPEDCTALLRASESLRKLDFEVDDTACPSIDDVRFRVMELKARKPNVRCVVVDFLQLVTAGLRGKTTADELTHISYGLKAMAKECELVVIAPCQLNYKDIDGDKREPELRDLQGSSGMAQAADAVFLVHRSGGSPADSAFALDETFHVSCAASRRTARFKCQFQWKGRFMRVEERIYGAA